MKTVVIIPIKKKSERVKGKNFKKVNGVPLYAITLKKLKNVISMRFMLIQTVKK